MKMMNDKHWTKNLALGMGAMILTAMVGFGCSVEQTEEGEMPDVDVDVEAGKLPEYDVDTPDIDVGTTQKTVEIPKVDVHMEEETITVPYVDVEWPGETETDDRQVTVAVDVPNDSYKVEIEEIHIVDDELWVLSRVDGNATATGESKRVTDTVVLNVPDMDVKHFVIGSDTDDIDIDGDHEFIRSRGEIAEKLRNARHLYSS